MLVIGRKPLFRGARPRSDAAALAALRRTGHGVWIGPDIYVRVLEYENGKYGPLVRIGIDAPRDVEIRRDELEPL